MKRFKFNILMAVVLTGSLAMMCEDNYKPEEYSSEYPVDFVYINNSDYKITALLLDHRMYVYDTLLSNKPTFNLKHNESVTIVTNDKVDGSKAIFKQYLVMFNDSLYFDCYARPRRELYGRGWRSYIPLFPISYKILPDVNERNHTVYEFTFTNEHLEDVASYAWSYGKVITDEQGERHLVKPKIGQN